MKKILNICLVVLVLSGFSSCNDWLSLDPEDSVIRSRFWKTEGEAQSALMGCYASMLDDNVLTRYFVWGEMRAEMVGLTSRADNDLVAIRDGEITKNNRYSRWEAFYKTINECNTLIELAPEAQDNDMSFTERNLKQYIAEATCIRSLAYFYLLRTFRDVPYNTVASIYDNQEFSLPITPQDTIVDNLIESLTSIENDLAYSFEDNASSKGRFTVWGMKALLADIYLWKGDYENCIAQCNQIINSNQFSLIRVGREATEVDSELPGVPVTVYEASSSDMSALFTQMYATGNSRESILELNCGTDKNNPFVNMFHPDRAMIQAKLPDLRNEYFPTSSYSRLWMDIRVDGIAYNSQGYIWKWVGLERENNVSRTVTASHSNWIFYRLADIILMKAEALTQQAILAGDDQEKLREARELVGQIRERANAPETTDPFFMLEEPENMELDAIVMEGFILNERAREFLFEGKRWFDVLRHARRNNYSERNLSYLINLAILSATPDKITSLQNKWQNNYGSHYMPIHIEELDANKNLEQNDFYRDDNN